MFSVRVVVLTYNLSNCSDTTLSFKTLMNRRRGENAGLSVLIIQSWTVEQEGYNDGVPVTEDWFREHISGKHNSEIGKDLFPSWDQEKQDKWLDEKEAYFRRLYPSSHACVAYGQPLSMIFLETDFCFLEGALSQEFFLHSLFVPTMRCYLTLRHWGKQAGGSTFGTCQGPAQTDGLGS